MKKPNRKYKENFNLRLPDGMRDAIREIAETKGGNWSMNDEFVHRLQLALQVPEDIATACVEMGDVTDRLDFAVRLFKKAGMNVSIPGDTD